MSNDSKRQITAQEATIKTASIEIKTLTLGNKQMTLAVFRQLPEKDIIDQVACELRGIPWGTINYHTDCKDEAEHLHVIWQEENKLYRAKVYSKIHLQRGYEAALSDVREAFKIFTAVMTLNEDWKPESPQKDRDGDCRIGWKHQGETYEFWLGGPTLTSFWRLWHPTDYPSFPSEEDARKELRALIARVGMEPSTATRKETLEKIVEPTVEVFKRWREKWVRLYAELEALDQLFIAV